ncbi:MAG: ankyrin repeat domain-containing protein [Pseudomonadales bacterium]|nr:ankyrin repeat domain-containing protein [Pseudomonadales bacterium]
MTEDLFECIKSGDVDALQALLEENPSLSNLPNEEGAFPLHFAALLERREIVQLLVNHGADINARDLTYGATPMGWVIEYLRDMGALLAVEIDDLVFAIEELDGKWAARLLERYPALRTARDKQGRLLAELALETGDREIMQAFIERD